MSHSLGQFLFVQPSLANHWRAIILFGRNSASYKFALAHALLHLGVRANDLITLEELAPSFAKHVCRHLATGSRQATSSSSKFLDICQKYIAGAINEQDLSDATVRLDLQT